MSKDRTILDVWDITPQFLTKVVRDNPSLRGMMLGYIAETKLRELFESDARISDLRKDDDHDRSRKGDLVLVYKGKEFKFEAKALQTNSIRVFDDRDVEKTTAENWLRKIIKLEKRYLENPAYVEFWESRRLQARYSGAVQCDASDRRTLKLPRGGTIETTCLLVGEFDILAAGLFGFREQWDFGFALNCDLPTSTHRKYPLKVQRRLLKSLVPVTWPLEPPFVVSCLSWNWNFGVMGLA